MVLGGISLEGRTNLYVLANTTMTAVRMKSSDPSPDLTLVQWALGSSWCRTMPSLK